MQDKHIVRIGDDGTYNDTDWVLEWPGAVTILNRLELVQQFDKIAYLYSQYKEKKYNTSCTKFSSIIATATNFNRPYTWEEIDEVEQRSIDAGFVVGEGWSRSKGVDTVRRWRNDHSPLDKIVSFMIYHWTPEREAAKNKWICLTCSISVDNAYWSDVRSDKDLDGDKFKQLYGHAITMWRRDDLNRWEFLDSVDNMRYTATDDQIANLIENGNMRNHAHIFLPFEVVTMITPDVAEGQRYSEAIKWGVKNGLTKANATTPFYPDRPATRAEVMQMLFLFAKYLGKLFGKQI